MRQEAVQQLVMLIRGMPGANMDVVRGTWPDCPWNGPDSLPKMLAWLDEAHPDLLDAVLLGMENSGRQKGEAPPPVNAGASPFHSFWGL